MAARAPEGPGDAASAALDELSRNFTYGALGAGNGSLSGAWYRRNQIHLFGVLLAILGNLVISVSLNIQKYSHLHLVHQEHQRPFFRSVLWWGGILLMAVGETGNFAAYGFAPITLIAPLGCMSVTGSAIISVVFLKENLRASDLLGMTLAFAGTYLLVNFAPNITQSVSARTVQYYFVGWQFLIYVVSYFIRNSLEQLFSLYLSIFLGVFCHSLVCSWSQEIEKRNICHSLTLILEIFLGNKCWTKYNQIQMAYPMELCLMGVTQQRAKVERRKRSRMPEGWLLACYSDHLCKRLHVFSLCQQLFYTDMC
ncbi:NIPA-like protein 2 isoform X10 [Manis pentadactyla]|uniref:NIPA-like protein 2 isoform X10 n=1 Tax=Manis pentadactyla TaxID=143292 RepID=UPI00255C4675|nr:NIPA-like protein 2 isoform X10 [Manis pentadactyla]